MLGFPLVPQDDCSQKDLEVLGDLTQVIIPHFHFPAEVSLESRSRMLEKKKQRNLALALICPQSRSSPPHSLNNIHLLSSRLRYQPRVLA